MSSNHTFNFTPHRSLYVDVDDTLLRGGAPNLGLIDRLRRLHAGGWELVLWSSAGRAHAEDAARRCGCEGLFRAILCKPACIIDNDGWRWIRYTRVNPIDLGTH